MTRALGGIFWLFLAMTASDARGAGAPQPRAIIVLDDGERISSDPSHPLPTSPWPDEIKLFALGDETVAFQVVLDAGAVPVEHVTVSLSPLVDPDARDAAGTLAARTSTFAEAFVDVHRATGNAKDPDDALHATKEAAPPTSGPTSFVGPFADALIPDATAAAPAHARAAVWVDVEVPRGARGGVYRGALTVRDAESKLAERAVTLRVVARDLPYPGAEISTFYEPDTLKKRMIAASDASKLADVETSLRQLLHAHRVSAFHEIATADLPKLDEDALTGALYTEARGYRGPGIGTGEGIFVLGAYGALGSPSPPKIEIVRSLVNRQRQRGVLEHTATFLYASDESCKSPVAGAWVSALALLPEARGVRVGATCDEDPRAQAADLVLSTPEGYAPDRAIEARAHGKWTWAYNGRRPFGGPMMLDLPATDLRANAWIAARYDVARWFYWESTFWLDQNKGGQGGELGFDPFVVAETFHNKDGDWANGDGILVYPGTQRPPGMRDEGRYVVFPSLRLKNLRRGAEDAAYIALARAVDAARADAIVARMIPRALAGPRGADPKAGAAWPERGAPWIVARRDLAEIFAPGAVPNDTVSPAASSNATTKATDEGAPTARKSPTKSRVGCGACMMHASSDASERDAFAAVLALAALSSCRPSRRRRSRRPPRR